MGVNQALATRKLLSAVASLSTGMESGAVLRPSTVGQCPGRLWAQAHGVAEPEAREEKYSWHAMQGDVFEGLVRDLLRMAGATVLDPVEPGHRASMGLGEEKKDPLTGFVPHGDGAILWPDVGIERWSLVEMKNLRAMAARAMILDGIQATERMYWFQSVTYLKLAWLIVENNGWRIPTPSESVLILGPKDPSTVAMFLRQAIAQTKYEEKPEEKKSEYEREQTAKKRKWRGRLEELEDPDTFYWETLSLHDPAVQQTWGEITKVPGLVKADEPTFIHDPMLEEGKLDSECQWYCPVLTWCRDYHLDQQLKQNLELFDRFPPGDRG